MFVEAPWGSLNDTWVGNRLVSHPAPPDDSLGAGIPEALLGVPNVWKRCSRSS
jgi:hypothetical protein